MFFHGYIPVLDGGICSVGSKFWWSKHVKTHPYCCVNPFVLGKPHKHVEELPQHAEQLPKIYGTVGHHGTSQNM
jgi:hypothetical protein